MGIETHRHISFYQSNHADSAALTHLTRPDFAPTRWGFAPILRPSLLIEARFGWPLVQPRQANTVHEAEEPNEDEYEVRWSADQERTNRMSAKRRLKEAPAPPIGEKLLTLREAAGVLRMNPRTCGLSAAWRGRG